MSENMNKPVVRAARRDDIPGIVEVWRTSVSDQEVIGFGTPITESIFRDTETLSSAWSEANRVGSREIFVSELDGIVVSSVMVEGRKEELEIVDIDVMGGLQGRGIGTQVVQFVEELARARGKRAVTLGTSRSAEGVPWRSYPWWKARGYQVTHEEENDWTRSIGPGVREIRMRKDLRAA
jgi:ribosomal protein S18 acetylase RimI-like enzyme